MYKLHARLTGFESVQLLSKTYLHLSSVAGTKPYEPPAEKFKNAPVYSFVSGKNSKRVLKTKERLFVWGYTGTGALGNRMLTS